MKKKYSSEVQPQEIAVKSYHYRVLQYLIHMVDENSDPRIKALREKYACNRSKAHQFCLDMKGVYKLLSEDIHDELILMADREFTLHDVVADLKKLVPDTSNVSLY